MRLQLVSATHLKLAPILAGLALAGCLSVTEPEAPPAPDTEAAPAVNADSTANEDGVIEVQLTLTEFAIESSLDRFETGVPYRFVLENKGALAHDFRVTQRGESETMMSMHTDGHSHEHGTELLLIHEPDLQPGAVYTTEMVFQQPGDFEFACHVAGHLESGMLIPITVVGEVVALPTPIDPESIVYDADAMAGMPCHGMGLTIMGDCSDEDVARIKAEILAEDAERRGAMMPDMDMMAQMMAGMNMDQMDAHMTHSLPGRIVIDRVRGRDEACHVVDGRIIRGECSVEDIARLVADMLAGIDAEAATAAEGMGSGMDSSMPMESSEEDHGHSDDRGHGHDEDAADEAAADEADEADDDAATAAPAKQDG